MKELIRTLIDDTLKKDVNGVRRFCRMKLTMLVSFLSSISVFLVDYCSHGFRFDTWMVVFGFASGAKLIEAGAKKLHNQ